MRRRAAREEDMDMRKYLIVALVGAVSAFGMGCSDSSDTGTGGSGGTAGTGGSTGGSGGTPTAFCDGLGTDVCADNGGTGVVQITDEELSSDTCFSAECDYVLTTTTYVTGDSTLTIEAGVSVFGDNGSALVVTTQGEIQAVGTASAPIVMTSSRPDGSRAAGDWGGLVMLGTARLSWGNGACDGEAGECEANIEGLPPTEGRGLYGGDDDSHDCGTLNYVRVEYAGFVFGDDNELNALTLGGCGTDTELDYIQAHRGLDDGIEFFGGTASISHVLVDGTGDDCFDTDQGYQGSFTNAICHHYNPSSNDPRGIEADNFSQNNDVQPRSTPQFTYLTIIGGTGTDRGMVLRRGSFGNVNGAVVVDFPNAGVDLRDGAWAVSPGGWPDELVVTNTCFDNNNPNYPPGTNCGTMTESGDCNDNDGSDNFFPEDTELPVAMLNNLEEDPQLGDVSGALDGGTPDYSVGNANCMGAFAPDGVDFTAGWTNFDAD